MPHCRRVSIALMAACVWVVAGAHDAAASDIGPQLSNPVSRIDHVLADAVVTERIEAWGISVAELRMDVRSLSNAERVILAGLLEKGWGGIDDDRQPAVTAQFLATIAMMRESNLFVGVITNWLRSPP